jgi:hypothetical protein
MGKPPEDSQMFGDIQRLFTDNTPAGREVDYHGVCLGLAYTKYKDGTFAFQGEPFVPNVHYRKIDG